MSAEELRKAISESDYDKAKGLIGGWKGLGVNCKMKGCTALLLACGVDKCQKNEGFAIWLVQNGADVNVQCGLDDLTRHATPLHLALDTNVKFFDLANLLIKKGADVNAIYGTGYEKQTPLCSAVSLSGNKDPEQNAKALRTIKQLLEANADVNQAAPRGQTALHIAVSDDSRLDVAKLLLEYGADFECKNSFGLEAFDHRVCGLSQEQKDELLTLRSNRELSTDRERTKVLVWAFLFCCVAYYCQMSGLIEKYVEPFVDVIIGRIIG